LAAESTPDLALLAASSALPDAVSAAPSAALRALPAPSLACAARRTLDQQHVMCPAAYHLYT